MNNIIIIYTIDVDQEIREILSGNCEIQYQNGDTYIGNIKNGLRHGNVRIKFNNTIRVNIYMKIRVELQENLQITISN